MPAHPPSRAAAEARCSSLRLAALIRAAKLFKPAVAPAPVRFATITAATPNAWRQQWGRHPARLVAWPWDAMVAHYRHHHPSRFDLAVWSGDALSRLGIGRTGSAYCSNERLEGSPVAGHPREGHLILAALTALLGVRSGYVLMPSWVMARIPIPPLGPSQVELARFLLRVASPHVFQQLRRGKQAFPLLSAKLQLDAVLPDDAKRPEINALNPVLALEQRVNRENGTVCPRSVSARPQW